MIRRLGYLMLAAVLACLCGCLSMAAPDTIDIRDIYAAPPAPVDEIRVISWNIGKQDENNPEIEKLCKDYEPEVLCLQEATGLTCRKFKRPPFACYFAPSWKMPRRDTFTGVLTLSRYEMECPHKILSTDMEFFFLTPKAALISQIPLGDGRRLMVINVHMLNFVCLKDVRRQYSALYAYAKGHAGPMIVCGDFNTWNGSRLKAAQQFAARLNMVEALAFHESGGTPSDWFLFAEPFLEIDLDAPLDRIFFRGFEMIECRRLAGYDSSDHNPLLFKGRLLP